MLPRGRMNITRMFTKQPCPSCGWGRKRQSQKEKQWTAIGKDCAVSVVLPTMLRFHAPLQWSKMRMVAKLVAVACCWQRGSSQSSAIERNLSVEVVINNTCNSKYCTAATASTLLRRGTNTEGHSIANRLMLSKRRRLLHLFLTAETRPAYDYAPSFVVDWWDLFLLRNDVVAATVQLIPTMIVVLKMWWSLLADVRIGKVSWTVEQR